MRANDFVTLSLAAWAVCSLAIVALAAWLYRIAKVAAGAANDAFEAKTKAHEAHAKWDALPAGTLATTPTPPPTSSPRRAQRPGEPSFRAPPEPRLATPPPPMPAVPKAHDEDLDPARYRGRTYVGPMPLPIGAGLGPAPAPEAPAAVDVLVDNEKGEPVRRSLFKGPDGYIDLVGNRLWARAGGGLWICLEDDLEARQVEP